VCARACARACARVCIDTLVFFQKDVSIHTRERTCVRAHTQTYVIPEGFEANHSHSNTNIRHSNIRSTPLKLIYIISSIYKSKIKCFEYFLPMH